MKKILLAGFVGLMLITTLPALGAGPTGLNKLPSEQEIEKKCTHEWRQKVLETLLAIEAHLQKLREEEVEKKK